MIYRVRKKPQDVKLLKRLAAREPLHQNYTFDYSKVIVKKPWGYEYLVFENDFVAIWMLQIVRKRRTSMHAHLNKKTALILLSGNADCHNLQKKRELLAMDGVVIEKGAFHLTEAFSILPVEPLSENGIWVMEIESPPVKTDLVRIKDAYGRSGAAYEGIEQMVFEPKKCFKLKEPQNGDVFRQNFLNYTFTVIKGSPLKIAQAFNPEALVSVIGKKDYQQESRSHPHLRIGELCRLKEFSFSTRNLDLSAYTLLVIDRQTTMVKLSDYVFSFIADLGVREVFAVCGGGAMHLVDSLGKNPRLRYIATHHEQAAAMAAEAYERTSGRPGAALVTSGPGGTNAITGVAGAWIDSIPVIFISGQVVTETLIKDTGLRQFGVQEINILDLVRPITKYAVTVTDPRTIQYHLQKAYYLATSGRPGPVWLDIPLDVQSKMVNVEQLPSFDSSEMKQDKNKASLRKRTSRCLSLLAKAKRPVLISGYGIRLAKAENEFCQLVEALRIPVVSSWTSSDLIPYEHECYIGRSGIFGDRASNFTVQNADLLLIIGSRMSIPQIGYNFRTFARQATKIMVDVDEVELSKPSLKLDLAIKADAKEFLQETLAQLKGKPLKIKAADWLKKCRQWKQKYPVVLPEYGEYKEKVNSFYFIDVLSEKLGSDAIIVTDMGTSFTCTMQTFRTKAGQRLFTSSGHSPMGFGLPGAIGACFGSGRKKVICISGDGGLQMNIQELQTLVTYNLPIILFVLNNGGYLTIKLMQQNHFGRYVGSEAKSGLVCPDIIKVGNAYGIKAERISNNSQLHSRIDKILSEPGPFICEIMMPEEQLLIPRLSSLKRPDGSVVSKPIEDLFPFLDRKEFLDNMIVRPIEILTE